MRRRGSRATGARDTQPIRDLRCTRLPGEMLAQSIPSSITAVARQDPSVPPSARLPFPHRVGRPTKLTRERAHTGASFQATCRAVGISKEVFRRWRRPCVGESAEHEHVATCRHVIERMERRDGELVGTGEFVAFVVLVEQALGEHEAGLAHLITARAMKDPRVALELLSRRYPESWSKTGASS